MTTVRRNKTKKILAFGDSLTHGDTYNQSHNPPQVHPYTVRLQQLLLQYLKQCDFQVENVGIYGEFAQNEMTTRLPNVLHEKGPYDVVIILGGTNDLGAEIFQDGDEKTIFEAIQDLHRTSLASGAKTILLTIPESDYIYENMGKDGSSYVGKQGEKARIVINEMLRQFANETTGVTLCDLDKELPHTSLSKEDRLKYWDDGLHYTPQGYDRMAEIIFDKLENLMQ